jgi:predicted metal-dependent phosphotriesterase family hydrolase
LRRAVFDLENDDMSYVQTVTGPVDPGRLGRVLTHEHLGSLVPGPWLSGGAGDHSAELAVGALARVSELGFRTVVDLTPIGIREVPRNIKLLREVAERTGLNIVAGSAFYLEPFMPEWVRSAQLDELAEFFTREATVGIDGTDIKLGMYGEAATGLGTIAPAEAKCLRAIARAHRATGLSINTHTTHGTMALEQVDLLRQEGVDLSRVVIGHMDIQPELDYLRQVLRTGVSVAFDTIGKEFWDFVLKPLPGGEQPPGEFAKRGYHRPDATRLEELAILVGEGFAGQLLLAHDMTGREAYLNPKTHGTYGYSYMGDVIVPRLCQMGVSDSAIEQMLVRNPARLLSLG